MLIYRFYQLSNAYRNYWVHSLHMCSYKFHFSVVSCLEWKHSCVSLLHVHSCASLIPIQCLRKLVMWNDYELHALRGEACTHKLLYTNILIYWQYGVHNNRYAGLWYCPNTGTGLDFHSISNIMILLLLLWKLGGCGNFADATSFYKWDPLTTASAPTIDW